MAIRNCLTNHSVWMALLLAAPWPAMGQPPSPAMRLDQLRAKGVNAGITVMPVGFVGRTFAEMGEVLALFLERGGMQNVDWAVQVFRPTAEASFQETSTQFGEYVRQSAISTGYALYAEILGRPGVGITEIRGILVDRSGEPVWSYRQTSQDEEFKKEQPREPLPCLVMLANGLRGPLSLQDPFRQHPFEGRLAKRYAERTGLPTDSERTAMRTAFRDARAKLAGSRVVVFPVLIDGRPDRKQSAHLAEVLSKSNFGRGEVAAAEPVVRIETGPNEQRRLWQMARSVREHLRRTPAAADYSLYADYTFDPRGNAFTVHFIVCDSKGEWVIVDFQNNHHPDFNSMALNSGDDCDRLVIKRLDGLLRKAANNPD